MARVSFYFPSRYFYFSCVAFCVILVPVNVFCFRRFAEVDEKEIEALGGKLDAGRAYPPSPSSTSREMLGAGEVRPWFPSATCSEALLESVLRVFTVPSVVPVGVCLTLWAQQAHSFVV